MQINLEKENKNQFDILDEHESNFLNGLIELKKWWFCSEYVWFNPKNLYDVEITNKYSYLFDILTVFSSESNNKIYRYVESNIVHGIGYILLFDQISRHIKRVDITKYNWLELNLDSIVEFSKQFYLKFSSELRPNEFCFVLISLRHTLNFDLIKWVLHETWNKIYEIKSKRNQNISDILIYKRFLEATYKRAQAGKGSTYIYDSKLNSESKLEFLNEFDCNKTEYIISKFEDILDPQIKNKENKIYDSIKIQKYSKKVIDELSNLNCKVEEPHYILSISGGVDSMILSHILKAHKVNFVFAHINYANRVAECEKEKKLLYSWSKIIGTKLYIRDIYEITRNKCMANSDSDSDSDSDANTNADSNNEFGLDMRNLYEEYTRDCRFQSYLDIIESEGWNINNTCILLAHNNDDCMENILTNIACKTKWNNLYGMEFETIVNFSQSYNKHNKFIRFIRPMLNLTKNQIYEYAHYNNIPYLRDSTPNWSQRGQIRDTVRPCLENWNSDILGGLSELKKVLSESIECVDALVDIWMKKILNKKSNPITSNNLSKKLIKILEPNKNYCYLEIEIGELIHNKIFWSRFLEKVFKSNNFNADYKNSISLNMLETFMRKIKEIKNNFLEIEIKKSSEIQFGLYKKIFYWKNNNQMLILLFYLV